MGILLARPPAPAGCMRKGGMLRPRWPHPAEAGAGVGVSAAWVTLEQFLLGFQVDVKVQLVPALGPAGRFLPFYVELASA